MIPLKLIPSFTTESPKLHIRTITIVKRATKTNRCPTMYKGEPRRFALSMSSLRYWAKPKSMEKLTIRPVLVQELHTKFSGVHNYLNFLFILK